MLSSDLILHLLRHRADPPLSLRDVDYDGPREAKDIIAAATTSMPTFVKRAATPAEVEALREKVHSERPSGGGGGGKRIRGVRATLTN